MSRRLINIRNTPRDRSADPLSKYYAQTSPGDRTLISRMNPGFGQGGGMNLLDDRLYVGNIRQYAMGMIRSNVPHIIWNAGGSPGPGQENNPPADFYDFESFVWSAFSEVHYTGEESQRQLGRGMASHNPYVYRNEDGTLSSLSGELIAQVVKNSSGIVDSATRADGDIGRYLDTQLLGQYKQDPAGRFPVELFLGFLGAEQKQELNDFLFDSTKPANRGKDIVSPAGRRNYVDSFPDDNSVRAIINDLVERIDQIQSLDKIDFDRLRVKSNPNNTSIQYRTRATLIRFYIYMVSVALINSLTVDKQYLIQDALTSPDTTSVATHDHLNLVFETPYVTTRDTNPYLTSQRSEIHQGGYEAKIRSSYNNYYPTYELGVSASQINEEDRPRSVNVLPNAYIRNIFTQHTLTVPETQMEKYDTFMTLDKRIGNNFARGLGKLTPDYYNAFGAVVSNQVEGIRRFNRVVGSQLGTMAENLIIPASEIDMFSDVMRTRYTNPMFTQISFTREPVGSVGRSMLDNNISSPVLAAFINSDIRSNNSSLQTKEIITTYVATSGSSAGAQLESSRALPNGIRGLELRIRSFDPPSLFSSATQINMNDALVLLENKPMNVLNGPTEKDEPYTGNLSEAQTLRLSDIPRQIDRKAEEFSELAYNSILDDTNYITPSEVIGYKISKSNAGNSNEPIIQNIMIGNAPESQAAPLISSYIDTQVMYGDEYQYDLYEYRIVYGTKYKMAAIAPTLDMTLIKSILPIATRENAENTLNWLVYESGIGHSAQVKFEFYVAEEPNVSIYEIPVYDKDFYRHVLITSPFQQDIPQGIYYPTAKVLDRPPSPPEVNFFPLMGNNSQFAININPQIGSYMGKNALEIVSIGDAASNIDELIEYQSQFTNYDLAPGTLEFANESIQDVRNITVYRTTDLNLDVENYKDLYRSFDPQTNTKATVRKYTTDPSLPTQDSSDIVYVKSYDILDNILPNVSYFYTVVVNDRHGNVSNPSQIYRIKLVLDKGLLVPEIDRVEPTKISTKNATKNLTRHIKIEASNIQSFPTIQQDGDQYTGIRSLGSSLGKAVENETMVVRLTSKDTGKKFDLKINFVVKVDGETIGGQT